MEKEFKILSIDGGGIRGIYPAQFLAEIESQIENDTGKKIRTCDYFDLICGTSTGGILALALSLGLSASEISDLYTKNAKKIFGRKLYNPLMLNIFSPKHSSSTLESLIREIFSKKFDGRDPIIGDCITRICVPIYDLEKGELNVLKTRHHEKLIRDWLIPAYQAAMATAAAPTFFKPYTLNYQGVSNKQIIEKNKIDGGVCINNPVMVGFNEAVNTLEIPISNLKILSLGTGIRRFKIKKSSKGWGISKWMWGKRLIEMFMQSQTDVVNNQIKYFNVGVGESEKALFYFKRIQHEFPSKKESVSMDTSRHKDLRLLIDAAQSSAKNNGAMVIETFYKNKVNPYQHGKLQ